MAPERFTVDPRKMSPMNSEHRLGALGIIGVAVVLVVTVLYAAPCQTRANQTECITDCMRPAYGAPQMQSAAECRKACIGD